jgi:hypothetical protein
MAEDGREKLLPPVLPFAASDHNLGENAMNDDQPTSQPAPTPQPTPLTENGDMDNGDDEAPASAPPASGNASRDADATDLPPPPSVPGRGPLGQLVPDVSTGSTPVTRRDD